MTTNMFKQWISEKFSIDVCLETARLHLHRLGSKQCDNKKGVFFYGHEHEDIFLIKVIFLAKMSWMLKVFHHFSTTNTHWTRETVNSGCA